MTCDVVVKTACRYRGSIDDIYLTNETMNNLASKSSSVTFEKGYVVCVFESITIVIKPKGYTGTPEGVGYYMLESVTTENWKYEADHKASVLKKGTKII